MAFLSTITRSADDFSITVHLDSGGVFDVTVSRATVFSHLNGQERQDPAIVSATASDLLQMAFDQDPGRGAGAFVALADLPPDDPDKTIDPAKPTLFHARVAEQIGQGQNAIDVYRPIALVGGVGTHLISRNALLTVLYTGDLASASLLQDSPPTELR